MNLAEGSPKNDVNSQKGWFDMRLNIPKAVVVAVIVGTILNLINQWEGIVAQDPINELKLALTYLVPFSVYLYGQWSSGLNQ